MGHIPQEVQESNLREETYRNMLLEAGVLLSESLL